MDKTNNNVVLDNMVTRVERLKSQFQINLIVMVGIVGLWVYSFYNMMDVAPDRDEFLIVAGCEYICLTYSVIFLYLRYRERRKSVISWSKLKWVDINNADYNISRLTELSLDYITNPFILNNIIVTSANILIIVYGISWDLLDTWRYMIYALVMIAFMVTSTKVSTHRMRESLDLCIALLYKENVWVGRHVK